MSTSCKTIASNNSKHKRRRKLAKVCLKIKQQLKLSVGRWKESAWGRDEASSCLGLTIHSNTLWHI